MVLKKMLDKFRSRSESKKGSEEHEKSNSSKQQKQDGGHEGGDTKKKLKKVRSVRVADLEGIRKSSKKTGHLPHNKPPQQGAAEVPNYMKSTSSYDARKEKIKVTNDSSTTSATTTSKPLSSAARVLLKNSSLKLLRSSMRKNRSKNLQTSMYTISAACSSTMNDSKTPESVDLNEHHDALALNVCDYTYCSLHGHKHGAGPSLKRFLSTRRQSLKVQKSVKLRGFSSIKKKGDKEIELVEDVVNELFMEIHTKLQELSEGSSDDAETKKIINRMNKMKLEDPNDVSQLQESCSVTSFEDSGDKNSELSFEDIHVINQFLEFIEKGCKEESQFETDRSEKAASLVLEEDWATQEAGCGEQQKANLNSLEAESNVKSSLANKSKVKYGKLRRQPTKSRESVKKLNPRPPRLLELQVEPEQEQVNLKHQTVNERKAAEEWMVDYALRKALRRLASARKSKVPLLVAAFETVPQMCEKLPSCDAAGNIGPK